MLVFYLLLWAVFWVCHHPVRAVKAVGAGVHYAWGKLRVCSVRMRRKFRGSATQSVQSSEQATEDASSREAD
ncbi:hypothetical protein B0T26DRAFT_700799 [Lasiosphaeria miniovina]|uniref:Secreted protein n=1 Tax=Lasiosphaeria miniovina TaxID=1954250 RepID=A0AA40AU03_9PEZI|nr:uncharacterized protein B0T26DRAFT_700799 [Lasiosphaeria miniovina]KAK0721958.1 hypothetical protein B0T26DRAFT_700799 [Lasiosphaeria miniovina]